VRRGVANTLTERRWAQDRLGVPRTMVRESDALQGIGVGYPSFWCCRYHITVQRFPQTALSVTKVFRTLMTGVRLSLSKSMICCGTGHSMVSASASVPISLFGFVYQWP